MHIPKRIRKKMSTVKTVLRDLDIMLHDLDNDFDELLQKHRVEREEIKDDLSFMYYASTNTYEDVKTIEEAINRKIQIKE